ncbi:MAG: MucR family transcriptional regulator [Alphaproteobacteria bacterium]|nr:MucR family transcriptional regulator [Alphaproteobacteria bacterium]
MDDGESRQELLACMAQIVGGYAARNDVPDLPALMREVYATLEDIGKNGATEKPGYDEGLQPAVPISKSIMPDYLICLEDGKKMKMLKRYLKSAYKMTPEDYREKWGLPDDYPMVAPNYAKKRSNLAKAIGLGTDENRGRKS